jgi:hypothetical protein
MVDSNNHRRFLVALLVVAICSDVRALAQELSRSSVTVGATGTTTGNLQTTPYHVIIGPSSVTFVGVHHEQIFGGAFVSYSYNVSPGLSMEARVAYIFGHQPTVNLTGGTELLVHAGLKSTIPIHRRWSLIGRIAPGISSFSDANRLYDRGRLTHFSLMESIGTAYKLARGRVLEFDVSTLTSVEGDISTPCNQCGLRVFLPARIEIHPLFSVGVVQNIGPTITDRPLEISKTSGLRNAIFVGPANEPQKHLQNGDLVVDNGIAFSASHLLTQYLDVDGSVIVIPNGDVQNYQDGGSEVECFFGLKLGMRREHYGIFAKGRPGFSTFSDTRNNDIIHPAPHIRGIDLSADVGSVLEVYPKNDHLVIRADLGEVLTYYHPVSVTTAATATQPAASGVSLLFMTSIGWRF